MSSGIRPLLAHVYEPHRVTYPCYVQPKLNGVRALYQNGRFQSRDLQPFPEALLAHIAKPLKEIFPPNVILDGELYVHGWSLQRILGAITPIRKEQREDTIQVGYHVFDVVDFTKPFIERWQVAADADQRCVLGLCPNVRFMAVNTIHIANKKLADELYARFVSEGYEGMMYRLGDCPYTVPKMTEHQTALRGVPSNRRFLSDKNNRCWHLLKRKDWQDAEFHFVSINTTVGEKGERGFQMHLRTPSGAHFKVSSGLTSAELDHYLAHPPVGREVKLKYLVLSDEGIPLNATILAII